MDRRNVQTLSPKFTHTWSLDNAKEAYELFDLQSDGKGVFVPS